MAGTRPAMTIEGRTDGHPTMLVVGTSARVSTIVMAGLVPAIHVFLSSGIDHAV